MYKNIENPENRFNNVNVTPVQNTNKGDMLPFGKQLLKLCVFPYFSCKLTKHEDMTVYALFKSKRNKELSIQFNSIQLLSAM